MISGLRTRSLSGPLAGLALLLGGCATPMPVSTGFPTVHPDSSRPAPASHRADPDGLVLGGPRPYPSLDATPAPSLGQDNGGPTPAAPEPDTMDGWTVAFAPYFWAANLDGNATVKGMRASVDASFSDILDNLDYAAMGVVEARKDDLSFFLNTTFLKLDADVDNVVGTTDLNATADVWIVEGHVAKDISDDGTLAAYAGVRYWYVDTRLDLEPGPSFSGTQDWFDPLVGLRKSWALTEDGKWDLLTYGDVGGGGFGNWASNFAYQGMAVFRRHTGSGNFLAGYRILYTDYETGSGSNEFVFDNKLYGPVLGWSFRF